MRTLGDVYQDTSPDDFIPLKQELSAGLRGVRRGGARRLRAQGAARLPAGVVRRGRARTPLAACGRRALRERRELHVLKLIVASILTDCSMWCDIGCDPQCALAPVTQRSCSHSSRVAAAPAVLLCICVKPNLRMGVRVKEETGPPKGSTTCLWLRRALSATLI